MRPARLLSRLLMLVGLCAAPALAATDGLEDFRNLAARLGPTPSEETVSALYRLVDGEIVENLRGGGIFASPDFIQERLEGFNSAWGGARFRVLRLGAEGPRALTVALYGLIGLDGPGSVRVFTGIGATAALTRTITHPGAPDAYAWPSARDGSPQLALAWAGAPVAARRYPLRVDVWRAEATGFTRTWSTELAYPDGVRAADWRLGVGEILVRYDLRYPGWKPGCDGQTEQEEVFRQGPDGIRSVRRQTINAWHRDLSREVTRFFAAVESGDRRALAELVPDASLRARLPGGLVPEPACDVANAETPSSVMVAATQERPEHGAATRSPWSLVWNRQPRGWRLAGAAPVLQ
jgi:hypothetical protein